MKKVCVLGTGSWGTALALSLAKNKFEVFMWTRRKEQADYINKNRENTEYLPGAKFPENLNVTDNIDEAIKDSEIIVIAVPSQSVREICSKLKGKLNSNQILVNVAKGLEKGSGKRLSEVCKEELPNSKYVMLSGPSHAEEVAKELPTTIVVSSESIESAQTVQDAFMSPSLRVYTNPDLIGVELGGALKNIVAFGAGICDGLGYGDNTKAALMTRGITEISRLGIAMGAKVITFTGLSGIGDLIVTCTSMHSRNRRAGILIGKGYSLEETLKEIKMVVEGITATEVAHDVAKKLGIDMPITNAIYGVLHEGLEPSEAINRLMTRNKKNEVEHIGL
ncbi:NAD(P)H-dependent glycerol-3-phosphate dehydrogenase [Peptacetobacter sp.]|uniref:NAD(P)H-dependent glycerol-3-phosphate dehydrogenase n=1 Tax=Peptacetobacter sp. TaxID=2991975 RepID=UPI002602CDF1|nr:NAD(P)H-dependent glycerol-3-phosphate dehydrogenase [Peptacetobacter sp.]